MTRTLYHTKFIASVLSYTGASYYYTIRVHCTIQSTVLVLSHTGQSSDQLRTILIVRQPCCYLLTVLLLVLVQVYAVLREDWTSAGGHTVCASQSHAGDSARLVYTSKSNVVEARLVSQNSRQDAQFLLKVERNASFYVSVMHFFMIDFHVRIYSVRINRICLLE